MEKRCGISQPVNEWENNVVSQPVNEWKKGQIVFFLKKLIFLPKLSKHLEVDTLNLICGNYQSE